jgi:hypothetical protein
MIAELKVEVEDDYYLVFQDEPDELGVIAYGQTLQIQATHTEPGEDRFVAVNLSHEQLPSLIASLFNYYKSGVWQPILINGDEAFRKELSRIFR